jgi:hypothetical protein
MHSIVIAALLSLATAAASAAGVVNVTFVDPDKYFDAGKDQHNEPNNLAVIEQYLKDLGQRYLPDGQVLNISVLGVDMAGYTRPPPARRGGSYEVRIARGAADWPRITLRYSLESNGQPIKNGDEVVADVFYGRHGPDYGILDPLKFEKRMLEKWFRMRFTSDY